MDLTISALSYLVRIENFLSVFRIARFVFTVNMPRRAISCRHRVNKPTIFHKKRPFELKNIAVLFSLRMVE